MRFPDFFEKANAKPLLKVVVLQTSLWVNCLGK